jgi:methanogenic corrinoid protein MtbC1
MNSIAELLANLEDEKVLDEVRKQLDSGVDPVEILKACQDGMGLVGTKFQEGEFFVSDLMMSGAIFKDVSDLLKPLIQGDSGESLGKVVVGTVEGDIHDIGKDLVVGMLSAANFDVIDLGVDVKPETFVAALQDSGAKVLGLSCLLTTAYDTIKNTVKAVEEAGLRDTVKIMIGGGPVDQGVVKYTGADIFGKDAQDAVTVCKELI